MSKDKFEGGGLGAGQGEDKFRSTVEGQGEDALSGVEDSFEQVTEEEARELFGTHFWGREEVRNAFDYLPEPVPPIPFTKEELERAKEYGMHLMLTVDKMRVDKGSPVRITLNSLNVIKRGKAIGPQFWHESEEMKTFLLEDFSIEQEPRSGWRLVRFHSRASGMNYLKQTKLLAGHALDFLRGDEPNDVREAVQELEDAYGGMQTEWIGPPQKAEKLAGLKINQLLRESPVEAAYRLVLMLIYKREWTPETGELFAWLNEPSNVDSIFMMGLWGEDKKIALIDREVAHEPSDGGFCFSYFGDPGRRPV